MSILSRILGLDELKKTILEDYDTFKKLLTIKEPKEESPDILKELLSLYGIKVDEKSTQEEMFNRLVDELRPKKRG
ncbi:hypothetical protein [Stygiolobus azoricus]|uniref:Uncharacterized protein n=1 Tax=Stygiolobus azoricus TaxID=41675 RepID=A0A650CPG0_9CREN|nr:hypothetical protein [Stygiolobus azoricus]QGR19663.1 hypothetical protein D1868_06405 [Stygiolobus azoricus]